MKTLLVLSIGAVVLATAAYAIGSTTGHGSATAASPKTNNPPQIKTSASDPWVKTLADKLGVDASKLADALDAARDAQKPPSGNRDDELQKLADALGVSKSDLQKALDKLRPAPPSPPSGNAPTPPAKPKFAPGTRPRMHFRGGMGRPGPGRPGRVGFGFGFGPGGISDQFASDLAKALGIDKAKVTAAFDKLAADHQADEQSRWDAYVKTLADKLGLSVEKVQQGLGSVPPRGFGGFAHP